MILTQDQEDAKKEFFSFLASSNQCMVLEGFAGTGKTTLVKHLVECVPKLAQAKSLITQKDCPPHTCIFTATTHKAAQALSQATNMSATTIHSVLGISVRTDWNTGNKFLTVKKDAPYFDPNHIFFIDEASYIDKQLLRLIKQQTQKCKVVFMGDSTQLTPVGSTTTPVFDMQNDPNVNYAKLSQVVRQSETSPIKDICTGLRKYIKTGTGFPKISPDNETIVHVRRTLFDSMVLKEFSRPDWVSSDSRMIAWRNTTVIRYNNALHAHTTGRQQIAPGDIMVNNHYIQGVNGNGIKTDALVTIRSVSKSTQETVEGLRITLEESNDTFFMPNDYKSIDREYQKAIDGGCVGRAKTIESTWIDLRAAYCCTINKAQGSTFDKVFIDIQDMAGCKDDNQLARLLYVAISRAKSQVILVGDLV